MKGSTPSDVLDASCLDHSKDNTNLESLGDFVTGVSLRATTKSMEFLTLFVSIPYLGVGAETSVSESRTLKKYRLRTPFKPGVLTVGGVIPGGPAPAAQTRGFTSSGGPGGGVHILVHQTWFLCFDNG